MNMNKEVYVRVFVRRMALFLGLFLLPHAICAQLMGVVKDKEGAPLAGAYICKLNLKRLSQ